MRHILQVIRAERTVLFFKAISEEDDKFDKYSIVCGNDSKALEYCAPCGALVGRS